MLLDTAPPTLQYPCPAGTKDPPMTTEAENTDTASEDVPMESAPPVEAEPVPPEGSEAPSPESSLDRIQILSDTFVNDVRAAVESAAKVAGEAAQAHLETRLDEARKEALETTAQAFAESSLRIRREESVTGIATALVEGAARFCGRAALFIHRGDQLLGFRVAGERDSEKQLAFQRLSIGVRDASAAAHAIHSLDAVVAEATPGELSQPVVDIFGLAPEQRVHLMPVSLRDKVLAIVYCDDLGEDGERPVLVPAIETLISLSEAWIEAVGTRRKQTAA